MGDVNNKYNVQRSIKTTLFGFGDDVEEVKVTNTKTRESATERKYTWETKDVLQKAIDKLKANER